MYLLTIYRKRSVKKVVEFLEPPTEKQIEEHITDESLTFDISRKPIDDEDIEEYLNDVEQVMRDTDQEN